MNELESAYEACRKITHGHYENFPVASFLLPKRIRKAVYVIYAFSRTADDIADEGNSTPQQRLSQLDEMSQALDNIEGSQTEGNFLYIALGDTIKKYQLPLTLFHDLLTAFRQDVSKKQYSNLDDLFNYCRYSANPVGRLVLHLHGLNNEANFFLSDKICTALQLVNFLQDIEQDINENDRIYLPRSLMEKYAVSVDDIKKQRNNLGLSRLVAELAEVTQQLLNQGKPLLKELSGRLYFEIGLTIYCAERILIKIIQKGNYARPRLTKTDWAKAGASLLTSKLQS